MKHTLLIVSCLSLGLGAAGGCHQAQPQPASTQHAADRGDCMSSFAQGDAGGAVQPKLRGESVGNYNKGYVDGVNASAFFNKGQPLSDAQVDRLIEIGRRQGDPTGLLALNGYPDGYRAGAKHAHNPYEKQMSGEQVAQVRKAQGLPPEPAKPAQEAHASAADAAKKPHKSKPAKKESAEAAAR